MQFAHAFLLSFGTVALALTLAAQPSDYFLSVNHHETTQNKPVEINVELIRTGIISEIFLMYRPPGYSDFIPKEMDVTGSTASATIAAYEVSPPFIEYYIKLITINDTEHTYPSVDPEFNPRIAPVRAASSLSDVVPILSPQENELIYFDDLVVSVSLFELPDRFNKNETRVLINNTDISNHTLITDDILIVVPSNIYGFDLPGGRHRIRIEFREHNTGVVELLSWDFSIIPTMTAAQEPPSEVFQYNLALRGESRNESLAGGSTWYNRSTITVKGKLPWVRLRSNLHITNEEHSNRQPQNRYSASAEMPWLRLYAGDTYPRLPSLIMSGRRLRGFFGQLELGVFNLDYATGQTIRRVEGAELYRFPVDSVDGLGNTIQPPLNSVLVNDSTYAVYSFGTHTRNLTAIRPSLGDREIFQWGFTYLYAEDDIGSVEFGRRPAENLVLGSDMRISLDRRRFEFIGQIAGSMQNTDISRGNLEREELEELLGSSSVNQLETFMPLSKLQNFITINQYLVPFDPLGGSSIAIDLHMRVNYFGNHLQLGYIRRGNDFNSFGLTSLRRDVAGFHMRDRLRLMQNQLYLDVSYESLRDNLNDIKAHTTHLNRYDASISYYPRHNFPTITVGYGYLKNDNKVDPVSPEGAASIRDVTERLFTQLAHSFRWGIQHNGSFSFNMSIRDDQTGRNADIDVYNVLAMVNSRFDDLPLTTNVGFGVYHSKIPFYDQETETFTRSNFDYYNIILGGDYRLLEGNLVVNASYIPTFGDYKRTVFQAGAQYYFMRNMSVVLRADYLQNPNTRDDIISNLTLRYDL